jgi:ARG/rhodanese/phosphatase superfamily protein
VYLVVEADNPLQEGRAMKTGHWLVLVLGLAAILAPSAAAAPPSDTPAGWTVSRPFTYKNLAVYLIRGKDVLPDKKLLTLQEALEQKKVIVHETGSVNELAVENLSPDAEVFIQAGDIVKGGRQDRVLAYDLIVPAKSGKVPLASFCVEAGRWQGRGGEDTARFSGSAGQLPGKALRLAVSSARQQGQVWEKVKEQQQKLGRRLKKSVADPRSPSSLQLTLEDKELLAKVNAYVARLEKCMADTRDVVGFAVTINGKLEGAEVYGSSALFRKMWPKLLRAAAVDAFAEQQQGRKYELAEIDEVKAFLSEGSKGKRTDTDVNKRIRVTTRQGAAALYIESRDRDHKGTILHRSYIAR